MLFHGKVGVVRVLTSLRVHKALFHLFQFDNVPLFIRKNTSGNVYWGIITVMGVHVWDNFPLRQVGSALNTNFRQ